jgi:hypothetical protein
MPTRWQDERETNSLIISEHTDVERNKTAKKTRRAQEAKKTKETEKIKKTKHAQSPCFFFNALLSRARSPL